MGDAAPVLKENIDLLATTSLHLSVPEQPQPQPSQQCDSGSPAAIIASLSPGDIRRSFERLLEPATYVPGVQLKRTSFEDTLAQPKRPTSALAPATKNMSGDARIPLWPKSELQSPNQNTEACASRNDAPGGSDVQASTAGVVEDELMTFSRSLKVELPFREEWERQTEERLSIGSRGIRKMPMTAENMGNGGRESVLSGARVGSHDWGNERTSNRFSYDLDELTFTA